MTIVASDCIKAMAEMEPDSIDAICTDPPYGLEFMGKEWDKLDNKATMRQKRASELSDPVRAQYLRLSVEYVRGAAAQVWHEAWAIEALRVLKPGGHIVAFGGTRTFHRLACALEDVGFEIRDCLMWLYGCLTADAEILTENGWVRGLDVKVGDRVAAWDSTTGSVHLTPVEAKTVSPYDDNLVVFKNDDTEQVLTPNHRVFHQGWTRTQTGGTRKGVWTNWSAVEAADVSRWQRIRLPLAGQHSGPGIGGENFAALLGWTWTKGSFDKKGSGVRLYQTDRSANVAEIDALMVREAPRCRRYVRTRAYPKMIKGNAVKSSGTYTERTWFFSGDAAERVRAALPGKRPTWALLWSMTQGEKRAFLDAAMKGDGAKDLRIFTFYQSKDREWWQALLHMCGMSARINETKACVYGRRSATTELQARHLRDRSYRYKGLVWCVKVVTGAFVARRNGRVFITGNSGFPKSLDVSKAIDKSAGAEREVIGRAKEAASSKTQSLGVFAPEYDVTRPATDAARQWSGWGTALKPAWEPIILARKPLIGTVAENVLQWSVGGLNIDGCRVGTEKMPVGASDGTIQSQNGAMAGPNTGRVCIGTKVVRWPANAVLDETAAGMLDEQSGESQSPKSRPRQPDGPARATFTLGRKGGVQVGHGDSGGASRFFYTAKPGVNEREPGGLDCTPLVVYADPEWANEALSHQLLAATGTSQPRAIGVSTILSNDGSAWSMCWCGSLSTDPFHPAIASIIATETSSTTESRTFKRSARPHTNGCMAAVYGSLAHGGSLAECAESSSPWALRIGTSAQRDGLSTEGADLATSVASWLRSKPGNKGGRASGA